MSNGKRRSAPRLTTLGARLSGATGRVPARKLVDPFYETPEWRAFAAVMREARGGRCEVEGCGSSARLEVDHVTERRDGGADFDPANVQVLCRRHHQAKTAAARRERYRGGGG